MDVKTPEERSKNMAAIKNRNTKPEMMLRKALFNSGFRYRLNYKLPGKPDIVFVKQKTAIFIDGCFWHACPQCYRAPERNREFWRQKAEINQRRDMEVNELLTESGWLVLRFWEHDVQKNIEAVVDKIKKNLLASKHD